VCLLGASYLDHLEDQGAECEQRSKENAQFSQRHAFLLKISGEIAAAIRLALQTILSTDANGRIDNETWILALPAKPQVKLRTESPC
jgi:hypothetical protein